MRNVFFSLKNNNNNKGDYTKGEIKILLVRFFVDKRVKIFFFFFLDDIYYILGYGNYLRIERKNVV